MIFSKESNLNKKKNPKAMVSIAIIHGNVANGVCNYHMKEIMPWILGVYIRNIYEDGIQWEMMKPLLHGYNVPNNSIDVIKPNIPIISITLLTYQWCFLLLGSLHHVECHICELCYQFYFSFIFKIYHAYIISQFTTQFYILHPVLFISPFLEFFFPFLYVHLKKY